MSPRILLLVLYLLVGPLYAGPPVVLVLGDSLSAGFGIDIDQGWVRLLEQRLNRTAPRYQVVNASTGGNTSRSALSLLPKAMARHRPSIVLVEIGGNDGLQGLPLNELRANLATIVETIKRQGAEVLLLGMRLPPNYGPTYNERFHRIYREIAAEYGVPLVPFLLEGVGGQSALMQPDGIHPTAAAQGQILNNVWPYLKPLLDSLGSTTGDQGGV